MQPPNPAGEHPGSGLGLPEQASKALRVWGPCASLWPKALKSKSQAARKMDVGASSKLLFCPDPRGLLDAPEITLFEIRLHQQRKSHGKQVYFAGQV